MRPAATLPVHRVPGTDYVLVDYGRVRGCRFRWQLVPVNGIAWTPTQFESTDDMTAYLSVGRGNRTVAAAFEVARAVDEEAGS